MNMHRTLDDRVRRNCMHDIQKCMHRFVGFDSEQCRADVAAKLNVQ